VRSMFITSNIVQAHTVCPRKAFLLLYADGSQSTAGPHAYVQIIEERAKVNQAKHIAQIVQRAGTFCCSDITTLSAGPSFLVSVTMRSGDLEARSDVLTKVNTSSGLGRYSYEPTIVVGTHSSTPVRHRSHVFL